MANHTIQRKDSERKEHPKTVFNLSSRDFEAACRNAVTGRKTLPSMEYVTMLDKETGQISKVFADGRVEYVL